jgi:hypothetical protein
MTPTVFNPPAFRARYPEFAGAADNTLQAYFDEAAAVYLNNTLLSPVTSDAARGVMFNYLVAHLAALAAAPLVGRIASATEGSVTVAVAMDAQPGSAAWYQQTKYGAAFWQAARPYRTFRYVQKPQPWRP